MMNLKQLTTPLNQALGIALSQKLSTDNIRTKNNPPVGLDLESIEQVLRLAEQRADNDSIDAEDFNQAFNSPSINARLVGVPTGMRCGGPAYLYRPYRNASAASVRSFRKPIQCRQA